MKIIAVKLLNPTQGKVQNRKRFENIIKGLNFDMPYYFYKNYELTNNLELIKEKKDKLPFIDNYYNPIKKNDELSINVCAIVGKNGSGKSSLIELIIRIINNFASSIIGDLPVFNSAHPLHFVPDVFAEFYYEVDEIFYKIVQKGNGVYLYKSGKNDPLHHDIHNGYGWANYRSTSILKETELTHLFYTVVINYSHYSYNLYDFKPEWSSIDLMDAKLNISEIEKEKRKKEGKPEILDVERSWLTGIFHKNDGYQTPIVLNPYNLSSTKKGE